MENRNNRGRNQGGGGSRRRYPHAWSPYNFVPLPSAPLSAELSQTDDTKDKNPIPQRYDEYTAERHTGYFNVTLKTETPLFVRGMLTVTEQESGVEIRKNPNAFSVDNKLPLIPGSSLRGMIRTLVEIVTNSKMHFVSDNKLVYRAIYYADALANDYRRITAGVISGKEYIYPSRQMQGGYLQKGESESGWVIQPAKSPHGESIALVDREDVLSAGIAERPTLKTYPVGIKPATARIVHTGKEGVKLHIALANGISKKTDAGYESATLIISNTVGKIGGRGSNRRWYPAIYEAAPETVDAIPISQQMWDDFIKDRDLNRGIANRKLENPGDVLFYLLDNKGELLFFGPTMFFRIPYEKNIGSLMPESIRQKTSQLDYTEALFGYVSEQDEKRTPSAYAGRISVTSAYVTPDSPHYDAPFDETIIPKILSSPKPTTFQHYLEQPDEAKGLNGDVSKLHHYGNAKAKIRGHKLYWRQLIQSAKAVAETDPNKNPETSTQHTIMQPVRKDVQFAFKLHFENLTDAELGALIWVLTFGGAAEARHQLGMGKPFGLGVVKLAPELVLTPRRERETGRYGKLFHDDGRWFSAEKLADENELTDFVNEFKSKIPNFDEQPRIKELMVLVQKQEPNPVLFNYMQIEGYDEYGEKHNQYQGRPVLQHPTELLQQIQQEMQQLQEQKKLASIDEIKARVLKSGLEVGDIVGGELSGSKGGWNPDNSQFWFTPRKFYHNAGAFSLSQEIRDDYEGRVSISKDSLSTRDIKARVIEIDTARNPVRLICEWVD
jgi:CRISPR-associated protein (TIGR03986 family)